MIRKVLVIRFSALGDIAMTVPVVASFCAQYPDIEVTMLTSKMGEKIYRAVLPDVKNLQILGCNPKTDYPGIPGLNRLFGELRKEKFDALADLHNVLRTQWLGLRFSMSLSLKASASIQKGRRDKHNLVNHRIDWQLKSSIERYCDVFARLGMPVNLTFEPQPLVAKEKQEFAVGIAPTAQHRGKIYPKELMQKVMKGLLDARPDLHIYLFGAPDEQAEFDQWCELNPERISNTAGRQTLGDDLKLMSQLDCMVSMDSANMHLASLVGCRVVSIWGATDIKAGFFGYRQKTADAVSLNLDCRPCSIYGNKPCRKGTYECLYGISPDVIVQRVLNGNNSQA
jgi:ADP-heptose:LPS heptosyltransferase